MSNLKDQLISTLKTSVDENARNNIKIELRAMIIRNYPDKDTLEKVNEVYFTKSSPTPSRTSKRHYKVFTPNVTKKKTTSLVKAVVPDEDPIRTKVASDDLSVDAIEELIKSDGIEIEFGSIEAFKQYTEERFGIKYGRRTTKESVLNYFVEKISMEEVELED